MKNESKKSTDNRTSVKPASRIVPLVRKVGHSMDIARSKSIAHFAPKKPVAAIVAKPGTAKHVSDIGPMKHPIAAKIERMNLTKNNPLIAKSDVGKSSKLIKEEAIAEAFSKLSEKQKEERIAMKRRYKFVNIFSIGLIILMLIGGFVYLYLPNISMQFASAQANISATYPKYCPDGYSWDAVSYSEGEVNIKFHANTGSSKFAIRQSKSSWDSTAVKNQVSKDSNGEFITTEERGLTIYTYGGNASWVNGGILYNITGDAPLSGDQIRRIATSL